MDKDFWHKRWLNHDTPWDMGSACPALIAYCEQLEDLGIAILIPGAGSGYEADWLWQHSFSNVTVLDISGEALARLEDRMPNFPKRMLIEGDFFEMDGQYDLILEQTFFCALDPKQRPSYALKMFSLLKPGGTLAGVWFDFPLSEEGPPFGGGEEEYRRLFGPLFEIKVMERCYNSIKPREGRELFLILKKRILEA